jgi:hypothetical protein
VLIGFIMMGWQIEPDPLLPDLRTLPPYDLQLSVWNNGSRKILRFSNAILNGGTADLIVRGTFNRRTLIVTIDQIIQNADGTPERAPMGALIFHAEHGHWHWEGFSLYEVWSTDLGGSLAAVVASSGKVSFCMRDDAQGETALSPAAVSARPKYTGCNWQEQGLSAGWLDIYDLHTPGQTLDISHLPDGTYALASTVNPDGLLLEMDTGNNRALTYFRMEGRALQVLSIVREPADRFARNGIEIGFRD